MWNRILVPHDFSSCAENALELACRFARTNGAPILLLHVTTLPPNLPADTLVLPHASSEAKRIDELARAGSQRELDAIASQVRARGVDATIASIVTSTNDVAGEILRFAAAQDADVIVLGTHGRTGLAHLLLGSVAEKVIRGARVPVVTVRSQEGEARATAEESLAEDEENG